MTPENKQGAFQAVKVADDVYWVGAIDWDIRNFHGHLTNHGTTYNAFLILADKITLIDTVKPAFFDEMMARISSIIEPGKIDYIVSNHAEMDHSGAIPRAVHTIKPEKVFASKMGVKALADHFHRGLEFTEVNTDQPLDLGNMKLSFVETRMCHWPDSMVSYLHDRELMFSQDAFGMHLASYELFADKLDADIMDAEAASYYANVLLPLGSFVGKALVGINALGLKPQIIAPDHGPIWRRPEDINGIIGKYARWSDPKPTNKAIIIYDSMWGSTAKMARAIGEGLSGTGTGAKVKLMSMSDSHRSDVATELLGTGALVVGSPTINNNIFPTIADIMAYLKGLKPRNMVAGAFGSYGWSGEAPKHLNAMLEEMGLAVAGEPLRIRYVPDKDAMSACYEFGKTLAGKLQEIC